MFLSENTGKVYEALFGNDVLCSVVSNSCRNYPVQINVPWKCLKNTTGKTKSNRLNYNKPGHLVNTMTDTEALIKANSQAIDKLSNAVDALVTQFIRPTAQQSFSNFERLDRLETALETLVVNIAKLEIKVTEQSNQVQILVDEGRADRKAQRDALAAILINGNRINALEQKAS